PKGMFRAPLDGFFLDQRLPYVDELLSDASIKKAGYFDPKAVREWRGKYKGLSPWGYQRQSGELGLVAGFVGHMWRLTLFATPLASLPDWRKLAGVPSEWSDLDFAESRAESVA